MVDFMKESKRAWNWLRLIILAFLFSVGLGVGGILPLQAADLPGPGDLPASIDDSKRATTDLSANLVKAEAAEPGQAGQQSTSYQVDSPESWQATIEAINQNSADAIIDLTGEITLTEGVSFADQAKKIIMRSAGQEAGIIYSPKDDTIVKPLLDVPEAINFLIEGEITFSGKGAGKNVVSALNRQGAFINKQGGSMTLEGARFQDLSIGSGDHPTAAVVQTGGLLTMKDVIFANVHIPYSARGGALFLQKQARATISGSRFENNQAKNGGAIFIDDGSHLEVQTGTAFRVNSADTGIREDSVEKTGGKGGAIIVNGEGSSLTLGQEGDDPDGGSISFEGNRAFYGGAICVQQGARLLQNTGQVINNWARKGAGIHVNDGGFFEMNGGLIDGNMAEGNPDGADDMTKYIQATGGGIRIEKAKATLNHGTISNNIVRGYKNGPTGHGAGIHVVGHLTGPDYQPDVLLLKNALIYDNYARYEGGGIWICPTGRARVETDTGFSSSVLARLSDNRADEAGDDLYFKVVEPDHPGPAALQFYYREEDDFLNFVKDDADHRQRAGGEGVFLKAGLYAKDFGVKNVASQEAIAGRLNQLDLSQRVVITGNRNESGYGGGIGTDGLVFISDAPRFKALRLDLLKVWDADTPDLPAEVYFDIYNKETRQWLGRLIADPNEKNQWRGIYKDLLDLSSLSVTEEDIKANPASILDAIQLVERFPEGYPYASQDFSPVFEVAYNDKLGDLTLKVKNNFAPQAAYDLTIKKTVEGKTGDRAFRFKLRLFDEHGLAMTEPLKGIHTDAGGQESKVDLVAKDGIYLLSLRNQESIRVAGYDKWRFELVEEEPGDYAVKYYLDGVQVDKSLAGTWEQAALEVVVLNRSQSENGDRPLPMPDSGPEPRPSPSPNPGPGSEPMPEPMPGPIPEPTPGPGPLLSPEPVPAERPDSDAGQAVETAARPGSLELVAAKPIPKTGNPYGYTALGLLLFGLFCLSRKES
ncbi:hypothetical protein ACKQTC_05060 [Peptococcus simiae]|uniref:DUF7601 domain-containing protein n=1 Tax=Peptococcus simiae TaxID=1643805 RepID=A0ABW9H0W7_9FIRM